jgi:murein L,D-transpeptidase YafK
LRTKVSLFALALLAACGSGNAQGGLPVVAKDTKADRIVVDKSDRILILYNGITEIARYTAIKLGDVPMGHKQFEGDEKTPEGDYVINGRNPKSRYHLSLRVSYPNAADRSFAKSKDNKIFYCRKYSGGIL